MTVSAETARPEPASPEAARNNAAERRGTRLDRLVAAWSRLPGNRRGALWMLVGAAGFTLNGALVKLLGAGGMHPFLWRSGPGVLRSNHLRIHLARGAAGGTAMICAFYTLTKIPLADFTALSFTTPLFILLLAALILGERVGLRRWSAVAVGFLGVLVMTRPGAGAFDPNALGALAMALGIATAVVLVKRLPPSESQVTMLIYFCLVSMAMSAGPAAFVWRMPTPAEALLLVAIGVLGISSELVHLRFVTDEAHERRVFRSVGVRRDGHLFLFAETPDLWSLVGAAVIIAATLYLARHGSRPQ